jgi:hypothetical protein
MVSLTDVRLTELLPGRAALAALIDQESALRKRLVLEPEPLTQDEGVDLLAGSASFLELGLLLVGVTEAAAMCGVQSVDELTSSAQRVLTLAQGLTGLNIERVLKEQLGYFQQGAEGPAPRELDPKTAHENLIWQAQSVVVSCPIVALERLSQATHRPDLGHRCRMAWEALRAAVRRSSAPDDPRVDTLGVAYAEGRLTFQELVTLMAMRPEDVVALLEQRGYVRPVEKIRSAPDLQRRLQAAKDDRKRRNGLPDPRPALLAREVVATQRIENVDARPWVPNATDS